MRPALATFCVMAGFVFAEASHAVIPQHHLVRPLIVAAGLAVVVGFVSLVARRYAIVTAASAAVLFVSPTTVTLLIVLGVAVVVVVSRIIEHPVDLAASTLAAAVVFALVGGVQYLPQMSFGERAYAAVDGPPVYLVLLDGYPRVDVLAELGYDNQPFIAEMEERGFEHHAGATSLHRTTYRSLTAILTGRVDPDTWGTVEDRRAARDEWRLPPGFVSISSPYSHTHLPHNVGPDHVSTFDVALAEHLPFGWLLGDALVDRIRSHTEESVRAVAEHRRVFAHIPVPHAPYLFTVDGEPAGPPGCWPECDLWDDRPASDRGLHGTIEWLNGLLVGMVDDILENEPDAAIVLFGDHGIRTVDQPEYDYLPLLLTRGLGLDEARPDRIVDALSYLSGGS